MPSQLPVTIHAPSRLKFASETVSLSFRHSLSNRPLAESHSLTVFPTSTGSLDVKLLCPLAVSTNFPSGLNRATRTSSAWPRRSTISAPVRVSHIRAV